MHNLKKVYDIYGSTGGALLVLILLTGSIFYVLIGPRPEIGREADVRLSQITQGRIGSEIQADCSADPGFDSEEQSFLNLLNQYRTSQGKQAVSASTPLSQMAQWTANDATSAFTQHLDSNGQDPATRKIGCGATTWGAEILTAGSQTASAAFGEYKNSAAHNAIMLDQDGPYTQVGIGRAYKPGTTYGWYWVVQFGKGSDGSTPPPTTGPPPTPPTGGEPPTDCRCPEGWIMDNGVEKYPFTGQCGERYKDPNGVDYACTDSTVDRGWQVIQPGMCLNGHIMDHTTGKTLSWFYLGPNDKGVCGTDKKEYWCRNGNWDPTGKSCGPGSTTPPPGNTPPGQNPPPGPVKTCDQLYQARGYQSYPQFCQTIGQTACAAGNSTGQCQCTPSCQGGNQPPGNTTYSLKSTTDKNSYKPGETIKLCYTITPNKPFQAVLMESKDGGAPFQVETWNASGNTNECADLVIDGSATAGSRKFTIIANINGQKVAETSASIQITGANSTTITITVNPSGITPGPTGITPGPTGITPGVTNNPTITTTPVPGNGNLTISIKIPGISSSTNKNPTPSTKSVQAKLASTNDDSAGNTIGVNTTYDANSGTFKGTSSVPAGTYQLKLRTDNSLWQNAGLVVISAGSSDASAPLAILTTGDLNQDNVLDLQDYNMFISCYGARSCTQKQIADVNMDGKVNEHDLNIFYSGLANRLGD